MKTTILLVILLFSLLGISQTRNTIQADFFQLGAETITPRFSIESVGDWALLLPKNWGMYGLIEFDHPVIAEGWISKEYNLEKKLYLNFNLGVNHKIISQKLGEVHFITAIGGSVYKSSLGPVLGLTFKKEKISFEAIGLYSVFNGYKSHYSEKFISEIEAEHQKPIYISNFDPNSYWKVSFSYALNKISIGIISERMYLTGLLVKYKISEKFYIRSIIGRNFITDQYGLSLGISRSE